MGRRNHPPLEIRFWDKVNPIDTLCPEGCWEWQACLQKANGYGLISVNGRALLAHRVSYALVRGPIPDGLFVCHRCDNPPCVNPAHLFLGTHQDNIEDMRLKGRAGQGQKTHCPKGHPYDEENTRVAACGKYKRRTCRACDKARQYLPSIIEKRRISGAALRARRRSPDCRGPAKERTHCPHGHPYDAENTRWSEGRRACRTCERKRALDYYYRNKA